MGPNFDRAARKVGRRRLPHGYVAVLDDAEHLRQVISEIHAYVLAGATGDRARFGVLFRRSGPGDREANARKLLEYFGAAALLDKSAVFGIGDEYHYVIDSEGLTHVWNRHADPVAEPRHGQVALGPDDLFRIPTAVRPGNIVEFTVTNGVPRIVYEQVTNDGTFVVVAEVQHGRQWIVVRTAYKRK